MWLVFLIALILFLLDRLFKHLSRQGKLTASLFQGQLTLTHLENDGLIFGLCKKNTALSSVFPCVSLLAVLSYFLPHFLQKGNMTKAGIVLFTLGGISNIYDRIRHSSVTDYICFPKLPVNKLKRLVWNIADFMILIGAVLTWIGVLHDQK